MKVITNSGKVKISINIPEKVCISMDEERKKLGQSRSGWITQAILDTLLKQKHTIEKN